jgi:hypothetical protein
MFTDRHSESNRDCMNMILLPAHHSDRLTPNLHLIAGQIQNINPAPRSYLTCKNPFGVNERNVETDCLPPLAQHFEFARNHVMVSPCSIYLITGNYHDL